TKVAPAPGVLLTATSPPIDWASLWTIESPSPVPPNFRVVELSPWTKGWNRRAICSAPSPIPVSVTVSVPRLFPPPTATVPPPTGGGCELKGIAKQIEQICPSPRRIPPQSVLGPRFVFVIKREAFGEHLWSECF